MKEDNKSIFTEISDFKDNKVWMTKKSRMESEARMKKNDFISQIAITYYTFLAMVVSVYGIVNNDNNLGVLSLVISIGLFGLSLFISAIDFKGKAYGYKEAYTQLSDVENDLENLLHSDNDNELYDKFKQLKEQYNSIIKLTDNHDTIDFYVVKNREHKDFQLEKTIFLYKAKCLIIEGLVFILPTTMMILCLE